MGLFDALRRKRKSAGTLRGASKQDTSHLDDWAAARHGVEAYVEPKTNVTDTTVVLVAHDGEWTRRRVETPEEARDLARKWGIPIYDTQLVGYPPRMREWTQRNKEQRGTL